MRPLDANAPRSRSDFFRAEDNVNVISMSTVVLSSRLGFLGRPDAGKFKARPASRQLYARGWGHEDGTRRLTAHHR
jgi:hypothetical protein